ncbi:MAG: LytR C-terminal domain-containing protein [Acidimicrobiales bacterium]
MANEPRTRQSRSATTPQNSAAMGVILVIAAVFLAILLFNAGGGTAKEVTDKTAAETAKGSGKGTTTTSSTPVVTTPPASLKVLVGNGSGVTGRAKSTADKLAALGYTDIKAVDGKSTATTVVYFATGLDNDGIALARQMNLSDDRAQPLPADSPLKVPVGDAKLVVLVGTDFDPATAAFGSTTVPSN